MRSIKERVIHVTLFEVGALIVVSPAIAWMTGAPLPEAGMVSLVLSVWATVCNTLWTMAFDRLVPTRRRSLLTRAAQAIGLELLISLVAIPVFCLMAGATLRQAVLLDVGSIGFFIVYAIVYNWAFDRAMLRLGAAA